MWIETTASHAICFAKWPVFVLAAAVFAPTVWAAEGNAANNLTSLSLTSKQARCLAENAQILMRDTGDPVPFYFDLCLDDERSAAVQGNNRQTLPTPPTPSASAASQARSQADSGPVQISKALLRCVQAKKSQDAAYFDKEPVVFNATTCQK